MKKKLTTLPPSDHETMTGGEVLRALLTAARWGPSDFAPALGMAQDNSVKQWLADITTPTEYSARIEEFVRNIGETEAIRDAWWGALVAAWERDRRKDSRERALKEQRKRERKELVKTLRQRVLADRKLTQLPALFETDRTLPLATAYVELRITPAAPLAPNSQLLEDSPTLAERIRRRDAQRSAPRRPPQQALDHDGARCRLILGAPGSGKSSLLRRLALDIAAGKWKTADVPVFVEARVYALARRNEPTLSLLDYACRIVTEGVVDAGRIREMLSDPGLAAGERAVLLVDGLDEIAADRDAVDAVYGALADSAGGIAWIATARPAGLMAALNEDQRFQMAELDEASINALIENWCAAGNAAGMNIDAASLRRELDRVPGIREMATNPFLLTALCFLKSTAPDEKLPLSRIGVYESLLARIAHQAQRRHNDPSILSPGALRALAAFACQLYLSPAGPVQIFSASAWHEFAADSGRAGGTDFARHILPSRLLTVWDQTDPHFHFLHLTLQEHLIAQEMLDWPVTQALTFRFFPAWRTVFRFYGALLWARGRRPDFAELTAAIFQSRDINDLMLITLAEIFADAGIRNTKAQLGVDLREELLKAIRPDHVVGTEAFIDALALLDPDWLTQRTIENLDDLVHVAETAAELAGEPLYDGHHEIIGGRDAGSPFVRLARARTPSAIKTIEDAFWGKSRAYALMAAHAYAAVATPAQRQRVATAANRSELADDTALLAYAFALSSRDRSFLDLLRRLAAHLAPSAQDPFSEALSLVADIGGEAAAQILEDRLFAELRRHRRQTHQIEICARAVARLGGQDAIRVLDAAIAAAPPSWRTYLEITKRSITPGSGDELVDCMKDFAETETVLRALADAASFGRVADARVMAAVKVRADEEAMCDAFDLAILERHLIEAGSPPQLCGPLLGIASGMLDSLKSVQLDSVEGGAMAQTLALLLDVLGEGRWTPARALCEKVMDDTSLPSALRSSAIAAAGRILDGSADRAMLRRLEHILFDENDNADPTAVTEAIGRISVERLFQLRGAYTATAALQLIAAEKDYFVFESGWIDRAGTRTPWEAPPRKALYIATQQRQSCVDAVAHDLSRRNIVLVADEPADCCVALLTFDPLDEADVGPTALQLLVSNGGKVFRVPNADPAELRTLAEAIGQEVAPDVAPAGAPAAAARPTPGATRRRRPRA